MNLTPAAMLALALAALVGIVSLWSDSPLAELLWRTIVALVAIGLAYELYVTRRLDLVARWLERPALRLGRSEKLDLELANRTGRNLAIEFAPVFPDGVVGDAAPRTVRLAGASARVSTIEARPVVLGSLRWSALPVRIQGPLNLAWWSRSLGLDTRMRVQPDTLASSGQSVGSSEIGEAAQTTLGSGHELHHLRPYRSGDARHMIDWKATARTSQLITRVFSEDQHLEVMVLIDAGRTSRTEIDGMHQLGHYANLAARFAEYCIASDDQVGLIAFAERPLATLGPARGVRAVTRIREALTDLAPRGVESDVLRAALRVRELVRHRCLVVILTDLYEPSATSQLAQSAQLLVPKHLPLIVGLESEEVAELSTQRASDWLDPYRSFAAREYRRSIGANIARLGRLGAFAMTARASEVEKKVFGTYRLLRVQRRI